jgi:hypothetical protein
MFNMSISFHVLARAIVGRTILLLVLLTTWLTTAAPRGLGEAGFRMDSDGACRDRTGDLRLAKPALSQLS